MLQVLQSEGGSGRPGEGRVDVRVGGAENEKVHYISVQEGNVHGGSQESAQSCSDVRYNMVFTNRVRIPDVEHLETNAHDRKGEAQNEDGNVYREKYIRYATTGAENFLFVPVNDKQVFEEFFVVGRNIPERQETDNDVAGYAGEKE